MIPDLNLVRMFVWPGATDMRKSVNGLSGMVINLLKANPYDGSLYLFLGRDRRNLKVIYWDRNGFCLWQKKLETDRFPWPEGEMEKWEISHRELQMLLRGIDFFHPHQEKKINFR